MVAPPNQTTATLKPKGMTRKTARSLAERHGDSVSGDNVNSTEQRE
jgi:hypothetical protein